MKKKDVLNSPRLLALKKKRHRVVFNKIFLSLTALAVVFASLVYVSRAPSLNISEIKITGNKTLDAEIIKKEAEEQITGRYLWFFPKTNVLYYPKNNIRDALNSKFKKIKNISFSIQEKRTLEISLLEREAKYLWCGNNADEEKENCNFMDENGFIFDEAPYFSGEVYFKFYGALSQANFDRLLSFKKTLETMGIRPVALVKGENGDIKIFLSAKNSALKPYIIFKTDADLEDVAENLQVALSTEPLKTNFQNKYSSLLYIDLRFGNKVVYKFR